MAAVAFAGLSIARGYGALPGDLSVVLFAALLAGWVVLPSRATAAALSGLLRSRRARDLGVVLAALVGLSLQLINPLSQLAASSSDAGKGSFHGLAGPLRWTPPGLLATAPGRSLPAAIGSLLLVAAVVTALLLVWERCVRRSLEHAERS